MKIRKFLFLSIWLILCTACQNTQTQQPEVQPISTPQAPKLSVKHPLGIIGAVEPVYILPMKASFQARIDTGAETSSVDVDDYHLFERDGVKWVSFQIKNNKNGETQTFEKKLKRRIAVRRIDENERRPVIMLNVKFGGKIIKAEFSIAKREKFDYQVLIGRNIITGLAVVDTSLANTLR